MTQGFGVVVQDNWFFDGLIDKNGLSHRWDYVRPILPDKFVFRFSVEHWRADDKRWAYLKNIQEQYNCEYCVVVPDPTDVAQAKTLLDFLRYCEEEYGVKIGYVELGNELFQQDEFRQKPISVFDTVKHLGESIATKYDDLMICFPLKEDNYNPFWKTWNELTIKNLNDFIDIYAIHSYGNYSQMPQPISLNTIHYRSMIDRLSIQGLKKELGDKDLIVTEYNCIQGHSDEAHSIEGLLWLANQIATFEQSSVKFYCYWHLMAPNSTYKWALVLEDGTRRPAWYLFEYIKKCGIGVVEDYKRRLEKKVK